MSITANSGPYISFGQTPYGNEYNPDLAPSLFWGGVARLDPRTNFTYLPGQASGSLTAGFATSDTMTINYAPYALSATAISTARATTAATPVVLVSTNSTSTGVSVNATCTNQTTGQAVTGLLLIDGFASFTGVVAANVLTVSSLTGTVTVGMTLSGTGVATGTIVTAQLTGPAGGAGTYSVTGNATVSSTTITGQMTGTPALLQPFGQSQTVAIWNPQSLVARAVSVTPVSGTPTASITFTVAGYDIYGSPMTEVISLTTGSTQNTAVNGKKAFKYIASVTPSVTDTVTYSIGTTDIYGFPLRSDFFGDVAVNYNATAITANTGYTAAVTTSPATSTTGDVRGTYALQSAADGSKRLMIRQFVLTANMGSNAGLFGVTQA